jgi:hypothetical protein
MRLNAHILTPVRRIRGACFIEKSGTGITRGGTGISGGSGFSRDTGFSNLAVGPEGPPTVRCNGSTVEKGGTGMRRETFA